MSELSMLIYPWDLQADGVENAVETVAELGVTRLDHLGASVTESGL